MYEIIAQGVGIVAMFFFIFSFQQKNAKNIRSYITYVLQRGGRSAIIFTNGL